MESRFSHKWALQVLRQRGVPTPESATAQQAVASLDAETADRLFVALKSIEAATESADQLQWVRDVLGAKPREPEPVDRGVGLIVEHPKSEAKSASKERAPSRKHHIYGVQAALTIELDTLRQTEDRAVTLNTVVIEAAQAKAKRRYDWERKIPFQVMYRELPLVACALLGLLEKPLILANHGPEANKTLNIADQGGQLFVRVSMGPRVIPVPVGPSDVHAWTEILLEALKRNAPEISDFMQMQILQRVASMHNIGSKDK